MRHVQTRESRGEGDIDELMGWRLILEAGHYDPGSEFVESCTDA